VLRLPIDEKSVLQPHFAALYLHNPACAHRVDRLVRIGVCAAAAIPCFTGFEIECINFTAIYMPAFVPTFRGYVRVARCTFGTAHGKIEAIGKIWSQKKAQFLRWKRRDTKKPEQKAETYKGEYFPKWVTSIHGTHRS
jgi:hypothetical protein